jgi:aminopeptidase-like protein/aminoglycoside N3'-acetyltransferase
MPVRDSKFNLSECIESLAASGLGAGDTVFVQLSLSAFGLAGGASSNEEVRRGLLFALLDVIGTRGTLLVPSFTLSFERGEEFDEANSMAVAAPWGDAVEFSELVRRHPGAARSNDPLFSVAGIGPGAIGLFSNLPNSSVGRNSLMDRLAQSAAKLCLVGVPLQHAVLLDYAEDAVSVPWRYKRLFTGMSRHRGTTRRQGWIASIVNKSLQDQAVATRQRVAERVERALFQAENDNCGVFTTGVQGLIELLQTEFAREADTLDLSAVLHKNTPHSVSLPPSATMSETISALWRLPRDIVSDGYDAALNALATQVPMRIHEYPTGTECWTWLIPEKWTCRDARLETVDGRVLFSYRDNPLHAVSYSLPFEGTVTREELFRHLHTHPRLDDAIPFIFKYYERDWGLCCSKNLKQSLTDEQYRVVIDSDFSFGSLKVGECVAKGKSDKTFVLCAHLCHPGMVNDDLSGVVVGMQVMQELLKRTDLRYTYRFLILPETIGSVAYLSHNMQLVPQMVGGLFLEMLGLDNPHALQLSFDGKTEMDRCLSRVHTESSPDAWIGAFRTVVGNDERQFNAPGVRVPMLSLSRVLRERSNGWPYFPEYHSSHDTPELAPERRLAESRDLVLRMIDAIESNEVPVNLFCGEVFCSRYGLHIDAYSNPEGNRALFDILFLVDGTRSVDEIARICGISVGVARSVLDELSARGLIAYAPLPGD